jgi:hypothetical protein
VRHPRSPKFVCSVAHMVVPQRYATALVRSYLLDRVEAFLVRSSCPLFPKWACIRAYDICFDRTPTERKVPRSNGGQSCFDQ